jgi:hypothetical protein
MTLFTFLVLCVLCGQAPADEKELKELLLPFYERQARAYQFALAAEGRQPAELQTRPVLTWTNAERFMGAVYLWTRDGRPEVIGCIGSERLDSGVHRVFHEFHALTVEPIAPTDVAGGIRRWAAEKPGVTLARVPGAPEPAASEPLRLVQMRTLARGFRAWMKDGMENSELRLLPQPLHRYKGAGVVDGAVFSYVWTKGTDPEVLLVLECREAPDGPAWHYSLARFNWRELWATHGDDEVWRVTETQEFWQSQVLRDNYVTGLAGDFAADQLK